MSDPIAALMEEHRVIEKALSILEKIVEIVNSGSDPDKNDLLKLLEFFSVFADKCHHGKEEDRLFPLMEARGIPREGGPIGVMLLEHEEGRSYVRAMRRVVEGGLSDKQSLVDNALRYVNLLREHIYKEDNILYPMGKRVFTAEDIERLEREFEEVEEKLGRGVHEKYVAIIDDLYRKYVK
jgi:hemerythrin-like domain-containing protein